MREFKYSLKWRQLKITVEKKKDGITNGQLFVQPSSKSIIYKYKILNTKNKVKWLKIKLYMEDSTSTTGNFYQKSL